MTCPLHFTHPDGAPEVCSALLTLDRGRAGIVAAVCPVHGVAWSYVVGVYR